MIEANVLYHSLLALESGERFGAILPEVAVFRLISASEIRKRNATYRE
jgi:hypothetical protein